MDTSTKAFLAAIVREKRACPGIVAMRDLDEAVDLLWSHGLGRKGGERKAAKAEVERNTRGQAFRLDTDRGPLFLEESLWRFAGRSGREWAPGPDAPTWPSLRQALRRVA